MKRFWLGVGQCAMILTLEAFLYIIKAVTLDSRLEVPCLGDFCC